MSASATPVSASADMDEQHELLIEQVRNPPVDCFVRVACTQGLPRKWWARAVAWSHDGLYGEEPVCQCTDDDAPWLHGSMGMVV